MSDNWEMYFTNVDDAPAAMLVDLGIAPTIPDPERPMLLISNDRRFGRIFP